MPRPSRSGSCAALVSPAVATSCHQQDHCARRRRRPWMRRHGQRWSSYCLRKNLLSHCRAHRLPITMGVAPTAYGRGVLASRDGRFCGRLEWSLSAWSSLLVSWESKYSATLCGVKVRIGGIPKNGEWKWTMSGIRSSVYRDHRSACSLGKSLW